MPDPNRAPLAARIAALAAFLLTPVLEAAADALCGPGNGGRPGGNHHVRGSGRRDRRPPRALPGAAGRSRQAIRFELRLPLDRWNGKFYMAGCGGFCGSLDADRPGVVNALNHGLRRSYAAATSDSGHAGANVTDGRWALDNPGAEVDWGWRSVTETAPRVARPRARVLPQAGATFVFRRMLDGRPHGTHGGAALPAGFRRHHRGRAGPRLHGPRRHASRLDRAGQHGRGRQRRSLDRAKVPLIAKAVLEACDGIDGQRDGLIDDPRRCDWQPARLQCQGAAGADCLTAQEVGVLDHWYMPVTGGDGRIQYPGGVPKGSEPFWPVWLSGIPGSKDPALAERFGNDFVRYMAFAPDAGAAFGVRQYDFDRDSSAPRHDGPHLRCDAPPPRRLPRARRQVAAVPRLGDPLVTPQRTLDYYAAVRATMGGAESTARFARLFMLPGVDHCGLQPGPGAKSSEFDPPPALEAWVERDEPPADTRGALADDGRQRAQPRSGTAMSVPADRPKGEVTGPAAGAAAVPAPVAASWRWRWWRCWSPRPRCCRCPSPCVS